MSDGIFAGGDKLIPLARVQHAEWARASAQTGKAGPPTEVYGINVIMDTTRWDFEHDCWENSVFLPVDAAMQFVGEWTAFVSARTRRRR